MFDSLQPHTLKHARPLCPSPSPEVCPTSCPLHQWCHPAISPSDTLFSFCPQSFWASGYFPVSQLSSLQVAKLLELQFQHQSFQWNSGLISFKIDLFGLLAVQGTLKGLLQHHSSEASILQCSAFFMVQLLYPYMATGKTIALTFMCMNSFDKLCGI